MSISFLEEACNRRGRGLIRAVFITFSPSWDKTPNKRNLGRKRFVLAQGIRRDIVPCGREGMEIGEPGGWSGCLLSQEAERTLGLSSAQLLLIQCDRSAGVVLPTVKMGLPSSVKPLWKCPYRHSQSGNSPQSLCY